MKEIGGKGTGVWRLRVYLGRHPVTGKPMQKEKTFRGGERAASKELARLVTEAGDGKFERTEDLTVGQLLDRWIAFTEPTRRPNTIVNVKRKVDGRIRPAIGSRKLTDLTPYHLDGFYSSLLAEGLSTTTVRQYHAIISAALAQAEKWGWVDSNVARRTSPPTARKTEIHAPTPEELQSYVKKAIAEEDHVLAAAVSLAALTGCRRGELAALRWSDVNFRTGILTVGRSISDVEGEAVEGPTKTHQVRKLALDDVALAALKIRRREQEDFAKEVGTKLVKNPFILSFRADGSRSVSLSTLTHRFHDLTGGKYRFHDLRHFSVTTLIAAGVNIKSVAARHGHADATMTLNRYAHALPETDRDAADIIGRALLPEDPPELEAG